MRNRSFIFVFIKFVHIDEVILFFSTRSPHTQTLAGSRMEAFWPLEMKMGNNVNQTIVNHFLFEVTILGNPLLEVLIG